MGSRARFDECGKSRPHRDSISRPSSHTDYSIPVHHVRLWVCITLSLRQDINFTEVLKIDTGYFHYKFSCDFDFQLYSSTVRLVYLRI